MNIAIALAQFIMLALGVMAAIILNSSGGTPDPAAWSTKLQQFAAARGIWLLLIPALWLIVAEWCAKYRPALVKNVQASGVAVVVAILVLIVLVLSAT